jgi:protein phosphatase
VRHANEDSVHPTTAGSSNEPAVVMVADGMGGAVGGEIASRIAVDIAIRVDGTARDRVAAANEAILAEVDRRPELAGMGTTLTLFELRTDTPSTFAHVGDSRAYLLRTGELSQLTVDHTVVNEYVRAGKIRPEEVATHPQRSMLTRALGLVDDVEIDSGSIALIQGDRLLLCSDGVNAMLRDGEIQQALMSDTAEEAAWDLVERANRAGGHDNITALVVDVRP